LVYSFRSLYIVVEISIPSTLDSFKYVVVQQILLMFRYYVMKNNDSTYVILQTTLSLVLLACVLACCRGQVISEYSRFHYIAFQIVLLFSISAYFRLIITPTLERNGKFK